MGMVLENVLLKSFSFSAGGSTYGITRSTRRISFFEVILYDDCFVQRYSKMVLQANVVELRVVCERQADSELSS